MSDELFRKDNDAIQTEEGGFTCKQECPIRPEAVAWKQTAFAHLRDQEFFHKDRDWLLRMVFDAGSLKELQRDLTARGYHRIVKPDTCTTGPLAPTCGTSAGYSRDKEN